MQILKMSEVNQRYLLNKVGDVITIMGSKVTLGDTNVIKGIMQLSDTDCIELAGLLNSINNQGIEDINAKEFSYRTRESKVSIDLNELSSGEKVFLLAFLARKMNMYILIDVSCLSMGASDLSFFKKTFGDYEKLQLVLTTDYTEAFLEVV